MEVQNGGTPAPRDLRQDVWSASDSCLSQGYKKVAGGAVAVTSGSEGQALHLYRLLCHIASPWAHTYLIAVTKGHWNFWGDEGSCVVP